jgi:phosphoglycolate phosphatase
MQAEQTYVSMFIDGDAAMKSRGQMQDATIVFDLDGTMIDTAPDLIAATNYALGRLGLPPVAEHIIEPAVGIGAKAMISTAMAAHGRSAEPPELDRLTELFIDYYRDNIAVHSRPYPGLEAALEALAAGGARLAVCTNKRDELARKLLAELRLDGLFAAIAGAGTFPVRKPDAGHLLGTIEAAGGDPARAIMIGDSSADSLAARNARVGFIAVSFGYGEKPPEVLEPDAIIDSFDELIPTLMLLLPE